MSELIFEKSVKGHKFAEAKLTVPEYKLDSKYLRASDAKLPEVSELEFVRHYMELSKRTHGVDNGFYPLGSCTMKYNPKLNEEVAASCCCTCKACLSCCRLARRTASLFSKSLRTASTFCTFGSV